MNTPKPWLTIVLAFALSSAASTQPNNPLTPGSMKMGQDMMGQGMMGRGMMGHGMMMRSMVRHHQAMMYGIPEPYRYLRDPLPNTTTTFQRGAEVYAQTCSACHGPKGYGDGPAGAALNPPPANLAWLSHSHMMGASDGYIYWTVAEGGQRFGTAMPAFKEALSRKDIWAVVTYLRDGMGVRRR